MSQSQGQTFPNCISMQTLALPWCAVGHPQLLLWAKPREISRADKGNHFQLR